MESSNNSAFPKVSIVLELSPRMNELLTEAAERTKRSKTKEAAVRLEDHLINFGNIASVGFRFPSKK